MPVKEVVGGRGGLLGSHQAKVVGGSQMKGGMRKARKAIMLGKLISIVVSSLLNCLSDPGKSEIIKCVWAASTVSALCTSWEACVVALTPFGPVSKCMSWRCGQSSMSGICVRHW